MAKQEQQDEKPDMQALMVQAIAALAQNQQASSLTPDTLERILKSTAEAGAEGMRRVMHPQNAQAPGISKFSHPEGELAHPKDKLLRPVYFCGHREDEEMLTPTEIALYNRVTKSYTARSGRWRADLRQNGGQDELHVSVPCATIDDRMNIPPLALVVRELLDGEAAVDALALHDRVKDLEAKLAASAA